MSQSWMHIQIAWPLRSKIQQNTARPGKTGRRAQARHPGSMNSKEQTGNRALAIGCGIGGPVAVAVDRRTDNDASKTDVAITGSSSKSTRHPPPKSNGR